MIKYTQKELNSMWLEDRVRYVDHLKKYGLNTVEFDVALWRIQRLHPSPGNR